jgi:hypothetical protein
MEHRHMATDIALLNTTAAGTVRSGNLELTVKVSRRVTI